jgi:hypothetical protein
MAWKRKGTNITAQAIQLSSRSQGIRQLEELDELDFRHVSHPTRLRLRQRLERLLEAVEFKGRKALVGENVSEAEGEFLFISSHHRQDLILKGIVCGSTYLEKADWPGLNFPDP